MAEKRKNFALRLSPELYAALERWADDDLRSVNAQIEYLLTEAARKGGRLRPRPGAAPDAGPAEAVSGTIQNNPPAISDATDLDS